MKVLEVLFSSGPIFRSILALCEYIPHLLLLATENIKLWLHGIGTSQQQQEDMLSSSGDGCSHLADEESDQEIPGGYSFKFQYFVNKPKCRPLILCKIHY